MSVEAVPRLLTPPGRPGQPYISSLYNGEMIYIPVSLSNTRLLVTGKETENAFAIVGSGGTASAPIGFHKHREAHDVFLCVKGQCNVWANDQCRTLNPGDFASVPPVRKNYVMQQLELNPDMRIGCRTPISDYLATYRVCGTHRTRRLGRVFPFHWRALRRVSVSNERRQESNGGFSTQVDCGGGKV